MATCRVASCVLVLAFLSTVPCEPPVVAAQRQTQETIDAASVRAAGALDRLLPRRAEAIYKALSARYREERAMELVSFMDRYWRLPGNSGFDLSLDRIKAGLVESGFRDGKPNSPASSVWSGEYPNGGNGWEPVRASMTIVRANGADVSEAVFDPVVDHIALCMNSFSTPADGITAPLVYVGEGTGDASYAGVDVKGAVVLGDGSMRALWTRAVKQRGAVGVISAQPPESYTRPDQTPEVFQWETVPYDPAAKAFGFQASKRVAERLKAQLAAGPVTVKTTIETRFRPASAGRYLVAEVPGRTSPDERVVLVAHVQEPGANDNASGCATLLELARSLQSAIASKTLPPPARTITFIWGDEMRMSREWLRADAARAKKVRYALSLDMTGEDTAKTGGSFLIEKQPDPSAAWPRPSDPHTEWWGGESYRGDALAGSLLNDLVLAACLRRARDTRWNVQTNPYEGGSDHSIFLQAGIPALLATHFTDRYYHTNLDRADKVSPTEMGHVGVSMGLAAMLLASADDDDAAAVLGLVSTAAERRLALETRQGADPRILDAWKAWYRQAIESVLALPPGGAGTTLAERVRAAQDRVH